MPKFEVETVVPASVGQVFDSCLDMEVHTDSMADSGERILGDDPAVQLKAGDSITFEARHFGMNWRLTARVTEFEFPYRFVDEQLKGPFGYWRHEHVFVPDGPSRTVMTDVVSFASPFGVLGAVVDRLVLRRYMERLIRGRADHLAVVAPHRPPSTGSAW